MRKKITLLITAIMLMVLTVTPWVMAGQTSITFSEQGYTNAQSLDGVLIVLDDNISIQFDKNTGNTAPAYYNTGTAARLYANNTLTITPASGCEITEIVLTFSSSSYTGSLSASQGSYSLSSTTGTWTGSSTEAIVITNTASSGHARIQVLSVTYSAGSITQQVATPTFTPEEGTYTEAQDVTINCETDGATIYYTVDGTEPTIESNIYTSPISLSETATVKAMATKDGMLASEVATALYTIEIPSLETNYTLITSNSSLVAGEKYIIVGIQSETYKALGKQNSNNRAAVTVTPEDNVISAIPAVEAGEDAVYELTLGQENGNWTLYDAANGGYLYAASSSSNYLRTQETNNANGEWTIDIAANGVATIKAQGSNTRNWLRLNSNGTLFSCYASSQLDVYLYKAGSTPTPPPTPIYYTVNVAEGITNGTVQVSPVQAEEGVTIAVTATPATAYELATLTYTYDNATYDIDQTTMQFVMPAADVTVNATFTMLPPITIAAARALASNEYAMVQGVVTFIDGRNVYVQDETAGIVLFLNNNTVPAGLAIGDMVKAYGKKSVYNGLVELTSINGSDEVQFCIMSSGNELPLAVKTIAEILADYGNANMLQSTRVQIIDATIGVINTSNNTPITQDESTMNIYKMPVVEGLLEGDFVTVTGIVGCYNAPQLRINSAADVEFTHPVYPTVTANPTMLAGMNYYETQGPSNVMSFALSGENLNGVTYVYPSDNFEVSSLGGDLFIPENCISINSASGHYTVNINVRLKAGLAIGSYEENITVMQSEIETFYVTVSGSVTEMPESSDYVRITDLSQLSDGAKVIFAARFDDDASSYYAMSAQTTGKPTGVLFTSVIGDNETLPSTIADDEELYYWTVGMSGEGYTFTTANDAVLGYTSGTNFATGGNNTAWSIEYGVSEATAMVPEYGAFVITNINNNGRAVALNSSHNFGPYAKSNMTAGTYNFFIDIFATEGSGVLTCATPTFTPEGGTYFEEQNVEIGCSTADAIIYYTVDGSEPTTASAVYSSPIAVNESTTIKAIAMKEGYENSTVATAEYNIILGAVTIFSQDWEGDMNGWTFVTVEGSNSWNIASYSGNHYAYANGYNGGVNEQWCISPAFNLNIYSGVTLSFRNAKNYTGPDMQLFFSNDYDGTNPVSATWTEIEFEKSTGSFAWMESGDISLDNFSGDNCYIGYKYTSTADEAAAWEVDDITLMGFTSESYLTVTPNALSGFSHLINAGPSATQTFVMTAGNITPAPGGTNGSIIMQVSGNGFEISLDNEEFSWQLSIEDVTNLEPTTVYVRLNGTEVGQYDGTVNISTSSSDEATVTLSGSVFEMGENWNRITSLSGLTNGSQVILASRYDATVGNGYYAMPAVVSGKPDGVLFTSDISGGTEILPAEIANNAETYLWNVTVNGNVITLVNMAGDALGYSSSTNFSGNVNTEWTIAHETAGDGAMIPNYSGFVITNVETTNRGIAKNASNKFGAYSTTNLNNSDYNFYLDIFVQGGSVTTTVATPVMSMASGTYYEAIDVEITCATEGALIFYTTDGSEPNFTSNIYVNAIHVDSDMTIKAFAVAEGYENSNVAIANYVIINGSNVIISQDWEGEMNGWTFVTVEGNKPWTIATYAGNKYANANGYNDDVDNEQWCISPAFNLNDYAGSNVILTFMNAMKFSGPDLELFFSNDYDGQDPTAASWQPLSFIPSAGNYEWTESGEISLNAFSGAICNIGFKYTSTVEEGAASWEIDDIMIVADTSDDPYLTVTPNVLNGFEHVIGEGPSAAQTFILTGGNLLPAPGSTTGAVELEVNSSYEISLDGEEYATNLVIQAVGTLEPTTVYVRLNGETLGHYEDVITITSAFAETVTVTLNGNVVNGECVDEQLAANVSVWNNHGELMIDNNSGSALHIMMFNIVGQPVLSATAATGSNVVRHDLVEGVYIVWISDGKDVMGVKVVVRL